MSTPEREGKKVLNSSTPKLGRGIQQPDSSFDSSTLHQSGSKAVQNRVVGLNEQIVKRKTELAELLRSTGKKRIKKNDVSLPPKYLLTMHYFYSSRSLISTHSAGGWSKFTVVATRLSRYRGGRWRSAIRARAIRNVCRAERFALERQHILYTVSYVGRGSYGGI